MFNSKKIIKKVCGNCRLYDKEKENCKVAILHEGKEYRMTVFPNDSCHMEELGLEINQVRWWVEDEKGNPAEKGIVKMEYPEGFFGEKL